MSKTRDIADSAEVINYLDTVTSNVQDQIDTKASATNGTFTGTITADGLSLGDDAIVSFGAGDDLQIYHDSATGQTIITETGSGNLRLQASQLVLQNAGGTKNYFIGLDSGASTLYHNNDAKISTTSTGADITGTVTATAFEGDGSGLTGLSSDPTLGTLTKTFTTGESSTINLTSSVLAPVVSVTKEVPQSGVTNNNWDVNSTTENYTRLNSAYATTLDWGVDLANASYVSGFNIGSQESVAQGLAFSSDGTKMYIVGLDVDTVFQYSLSTAFDVSTASYNSVSFSVASQETTPLGLDFSADGTKMYVVGYTNSIVYQYSLSTAWDLSTASYSSISFDLNSQETQAIFVSITSNGTKMYIRGFDNGDVFYQYTLSTAYDVSTASYDSISLNPSANATQPKSLSFSTNGTLLYIMGGGSDAVYQYSLSTAFDISTATYDSISFSIASQDNQPTDLAVIGSKLYFIGGQNTSVYQYSLPAGNLTLGTGSFASADVGKTIEANDGAFVLTATDGSYVETTAPTSYDQVASGSWEMYGVVYNAADGDLELSSRVAGGVNTLDAFGDSSAVALYQLDGNANDTGGTYNGTWVGTEQYTTGKFLQAADFNGSSHIETNVTFNPSNTVRTISMWVNTSVNQQKHLCIIDGSDYSGLNFMLSPAFSLQYFINTGVAINTGFTFTSGVWHHVVWVIGNGINKIYADGNLVVNTSASVNNSTHEIKMTSGIATAQALYDQCRIFNRELSSTEVSALYTEGQLYFPTGYHPVHTTASIDSTYWTDINSMTADQAAGDGNVYYAISTDDRTTWTVIDNTDGERDIVRNNAGTWQYNSNGTYASETWTNATTNTELAALAEAMEGAVGGYDLTNASYDSVSFSVASQDSTPTGVAFNNNGSKMFVVGFTNDAVYEYTLSTGFDISTATFSQSFSVTSQETSPTGIAFSPDGTKMFVTGYVGDDMNEYTLTTGFDVSTASFTQSFSIAGEEVFPTGVAFNTDGTKMFISGQSGDDVNEYNLSTGFDLSTASYSQSFSIAAQDNNPYGITFNSDGTKLFFVGTQNDKAYQYSLSTGFDISTASFVSDFSITQDTSPTGITFNSDGTKMFVVGAGTDTVYEYTTEAYTNQMDKTQLDAVTDPNHIALGNDLDLSIIFNMTSGTTVPSSDGVSINYDGNVINKGAILGTDYDFDAPAGDAVRITALNPGNYKVRIV